MLEQLQSLTTCGKGWAEKRAQMAIELTEAYQSQKISTDEYKELLQDLVRSDLLELEADDIELKSLLVTGIYALIQLA
jgi:hypothetical protein